MNFDETALWSMQMEIFAHVFGPMSIFTLGLFFNSLCVLHYLVAADALHTSQSRLRDFPWETKVAFSNGSQLQPSKEFMSHKWNTHSTLKVKGAVRSGVTSRSRIWTSACTIWPQHLGREGSWNHLTEIIDGWWFIWNYIYEQQEQQKRKRWDI